MGFTESHPLKSQDLDAFVDRLRRQRTQDPHNRPERRREVRHDCMVPLMLCPWRDGEPIVDESRFAVARNVSAGGMGVLLTRPIADERLVIGVRSDSDPTQPWFFLGETRHVTSMGSGCSVLGISVGEFLNETHPDLLDVLRPTIGWLLPQRDRVADAEPDDRITVKSDTWWLTMLALGVGGILAVWGLIPG